MKNGIALRPVGRTDMMVTPTGPGCWQLIREKKFTGKFHENPGF